MELVDMQGLKPCPLWVLVQVQAQVILKSTSLITLYYVTVLVCGFPTQPALFLETGSNTFVYALYSSWILHVLFIYVGVLIFVKAITRHVNQY